MDSRTRPLKKVVLTNHLLAKAFARGTFDECGFENGEEMVINAIKTEGVLVPDPKGGPCDRLCIFQLPGGKMITVPVTEESNVWVAKTIYRSQRSDVEKYNKFKQEEQNK